MLSDLVHSPLVPDSRRTRIAFVSLESLRAFAFLGGRGDTTIVHFESDAKSKPPYVYKGLSFRLFLERGTSFGDERHAFYHELSMIFALPIHPNVVSPPSFLVTANTPPILDTSSMTGSPTYVCGALYPYLRRESLRQALDGSNAAGERLLPILKARWASQIASALAATQVSRQYHMDLKPNNVLLDYNENAVFIDWEQSGASPFLMAPDEGARRPKLTYRKYTGTARRNHWTWPEWNVFPMRQIECLGALEAAEVYSLGRTLWVAFEQLREVDFVSDGNYFRSTINLLGLTIESKNVSNRPDPA